MRMWMLDPRLLCRKHLLGEHGELHKFRPTFVKRHSIAGRRGQIEPRSMEERHDALAAELLRRGMNHRSPYEQPDLSHLSAADREGRVDPVSSAADLAERCPDCRRRLGE